MSIADDSHLRTPIELPQGKHGDFIVFADESGDHSLENVSGDYPIFVLALCVFRKESYIQAVCPALQHFKFTFWGHDQIVLHEREIRKPRHDFGILQNPETRDQFFTALTTVLEEAEFTIIASIIDKKALQQSSRGTNPYHLALQFTLERLYHHLRVHGQANKSTHIIVERRGKREDDELELEFRRICDGRNYECQSLPFRLVMRDKQCNAAGLQLTDLVARPLGMMHLRPGQANRTHPIIQAKLRKGPTGEARGYGLKIFPS